MLFFCTIHQRILKTKYRIFHKKKTLQCDTEDWSNDAENLNYILKYIQL